MINDESFTVNRLFFIIHHSSFIIQKIMRKYTTVITAVLTANMQATQFTNLGDSLKGKKVTSIRTRGGGYTINKKVVASETDVQSLTLELHTDGTDTLHRVPLAHILELSKGTNAALGFEINNEVLDWDSTQVIAENGAALTTGQVVELVIQYWK